MEESLVHLIIIIKLFHFETSTLGDSVYVFSNNAVIFISYLFGFCTWKLLYYCSLILLNCGSFSLI